MKIIELEQRSKEWLDWRQNGIGSSDIGTIMGANPYKTPHQLWEEKCGIQNTFNGNRYTQHGILNEPLAVAWLEKTYNILLEGVCAESDVNPIYRISMDGYCVENEYIYEVKCPYSMDKIFKLRNSIEIPEIWRMQILWQAAISKAKRAFLAVWDFNQAECFCIECERDPVLEAKMFEAADRFWAYVKGFTPPPFQKGDYIQVEDEELYSYLLEYKGADTKEKLEKGKKKELKEKIVEFGDDGNFKAYGFTITRTAPRKSYNIEKMKEDGIDVDKYLKPPSIGSYRILVPQD